MLRFYQIARKSQPHEPDFTLRESKTELVIVMPKQAKAVMLKLIHKNVFANADRKKVRLHNISYRTNKN